MLEKHIGKFYKIKTSVTSERHNLLTSNFQCTFLRTCRGTYPKLITVERTKGFLLEMNSKQKPFDCFKNSAKTKFSERHYGKPAF